MEVLLSHTSSLEFWRTYHSAYPPQRLPYGRKAPSDPVDHALLKDPDITDLTRPLHVTVSSSSARRPSQLVKPHVHSSSLPTGSLVSIGDGLLVSSPELCFYQMAKTLPLVRLIELGFELCGSYSLPGPNDAYAGTTYDRPPLTSKNRLSRYITRMAGKHNQHQAAEALRYIADGSASPMETIMVMLLTLPYRLGGYGLPTPTLNAHITASETASGQSSFYCDLYWPDAKVAAEYDSDMYHTGSLRISRDSARRNSLALAGISVVAVSFKENGSLSGFENNAKLLATSLGKLLRHNESPNFKYAHLNLRAMLLPNRYDDPGFY